MNIYNERTEVARWQKLVLTFEGESSIGKERGCEITNATLNLGEIKRK